MAQRNLTLTEELEKLEQSITLTLQEIDQNFARAHRIVTSSILPVVERYAQQSEAVWEGSKFWKQFFEASANITLSMNEEGAEDEANAEQADDNDQTVTTGYGDETVTSASSEHAQQQAQQTPRPSRTHRADKHAGSESDSQPEDSESMEEPTSRFLPTQARHTSTQRGAHTEESSLLDSSPTTNNNPSRPSKPAATTGASTPHQPSAPTFAVFDSPYETLKRELHGDKPSTSATPGMDYTTRRMPSPTRTHSRPTSRSTQKSRAENPDPLLHRLLDRNYRIQATPHTTRRSPQKPQHNPEHTHTHSQTHTQTHTRTQAQSHTHALLDSSPFSPNDAPERPELRASIFGTPAHRKPGKPGNPYLPAGPRTPGVSIQQGAGAPSTARKTLFTHEKARDRTQQTDEDEEENRNPARLWSDDSDSDMEADEGIRGMSPPKTMHFAVPQGRLLRTPAKEASQRIVRDLLASAGVEESSTVDRTGLESLGGGGGGRGKARVEDERTARSVLDNDENWELEDSPMVVRGRREDDDTF